VTTSELGVGWAAHSDAIAHVIVESVDDALSIGGADGHHLVRVRRIKPGEHVTAADGRGSWRRYRAIDVARDRLDLVAVGALMLEPQLVPGLSVAFALTKGEKPEIVIARLTELGVDRIVPVTAERSVVRWDARKEATASARFAIVAREAAMQSRRARLPTVERPVAIADLAGHAGLVVADPAGGPAEALPDPGPRGWTLVVGPEGGLADRELEAMGNAPRLALGPHVLRAETAAVAGAAVLTAGRLPGHPSSPAGGHGG
jgi:16S rRNA (uracil1498-N3)-methyltransferase